MRASAASLFASKRITTTGVVFDGRVRPKPSGYSTHKRTVLATSSAPVNRARFADGRSVRASRLLRAPVAAPVWNADRAANSAARPHSHRLAAGPGSAPAGTPHGAATIALLPCVRISIPDARLTRRTVSAPGVPPLTPRMFCALNRVQPGCGCTDRAGRKQAVRVCCASPPSARPALTPRLPAGLPSRRPVQHGPRHPGSRQPLSLAGARPARRRQGARTPRSTPARRCAAGRVRRKPA
jgi:hypothetical protein